MKTAFWRRLLTALLGITVILLGGCTARAASKPAGSAPKPSFARPEPRPSGNKDGVGTAYTYNATGWPKASRVWFTLLGGAVSEMYYPTLDDAAVNSLRFVVGAGKTLVDENSNLHAAVQLVDSHALAYNVSERDTKHHFQLDKTIVTDPAHDALLMQVRYQGLNTAAKKYPLYLQLEPTLGNSSVDNNIQVKGHTLVAWTSDGAMALQTTARTTTAAVGYRDSNDPLTQLHEHHRIVHPYSKAPHGRVAGLLTLAPGSGTFTVALAFGANQSAAASLAASEVKQPFSAVEQAYIQGWQSYCNGLNTLGGAANSEWYSSAMTIKASEDKTNEGAIVASLTHPFGPTSPDDATNHGYVLVWPRDLYHMAMGLLAAGDTQTPREALDFLARIRRPDGSEPQNVHVDGTPFYGGTQMDEAADAVLLAWRLNAADLYKTLVVPTANFVAANGPSTQQERWEEAGGYSPATIAAEVAALVAAGDMAQHQNDQVHAISWPNKADEWANQIEKWTYTTNGPLGNGHYFLRITADGDPNSSTPLTIANNGGTYDQRSIVDTSFLELVRLGVRSPQAQSILTSLPVVDSVLKVQTPKGPDWYRYTHDGYGDPDTPGGDGKGRLWPVFDGERGNYDVIAGDLAGARAMLQTMQNFAGPTGLIPEQVFEKTGAPTTSANPLNWAQGEYLVLARSIADGKPFDQPSVVAARYAGK